MVHHIDVSTVLRRTVCDLYSNLVTRPTGAAVRTEIEQQLAGARQRTLTVIDFSNVNLLDFSCADEIVAKLLLRFGAPAGSAADDVVPPLAHEGYFLFRGLREAHLDAIETVLEHHGLALVAESPDGTQLVGTVGDAERRAWETVARLGVAAADDLAEVTGQEVDEARAILEGLARRRLVMRLDDSYVAVGAAGRAAPSASADDGAPPLPQRPSDDSHGYNGGTV